MSSQSDSGIPLLHAPSGVGYRLIELPAELVSLMESDNAPVYVSPPANPIQHFYPPDVSSPA